MKGLFNYETAYREYTRECLQEFVKENIQWAEIRPTFMLQNQIWRDDGSSQIDNEGIMKIIVEEYENFRSYHFYGLKIIYCVPRSSSHETVQLSADECLRFKTGAYAQYIAGQCRVHRAR